ncbi:unnamed protein product [Brassica rapa]|uniref:Uncharacterized protein n=1 Tax=Brassica campestris TaxID=3711 RepID=A0A8D9HCS5_BRACM|nr:unnamed protein product [Brassica rapa]
MVMDKEESFRRDNCSFMAVKQRSLIHRPRCFAVVITVTVV